MYLLAKVQIRSLQAARDLNHPTARPLAHVLASDSVEQLRQTRAQRCVSVPTGHLTKYHTELT